MSLDDSLQWLFAHVPWYVAGFALVATVALSLAFNLPGWVRPFFTAIRAAAAARVLPHLPSPPPPEDPPPPAEWGGNVAPDDGPPGGDGGGG